MNIIDATDFPLNETTTTTTVNSALQNKLNGSNYIDDDKKIILDASYDIAPLFTRIIEAYLEVRDSDDDDEYATVLTNATDDFAKALEVVIKKHLSNQKIAFGIFTIWVSVIHMLSRSANKANDRPFEIALTHFESAVYNISKLIKVERKS